MYLKIDTPFCECYNPDMEPHDKVWPPPPRQTEVPLPEMQEGNAVWGWHALVLVILAFALGGYGATASRECEAGVCGAWHFAAFAHVAAYGSIALTAAGLAVGWRARGRWTGKIALLLALGLLTLMVQTSFRLPGFWGPYL